MSIHFSCEKPADASPQSPGGRPLKFVINFLENSPSAAAVFEVTSDDPRTGQRRSKQYRLQGREHTHYLDFFVEIAKDFAIRIPLHRQPRAFPTFRADYSELITGNLSPDILYGYGDPAVFTVPTNESGKGGCWYYVVSTSNDAPDCFPLVRSKDLKYWEPRGFVFPRGYEPQWAAVGENVADFWAPEIHRVGGQFRAYFVARSVKSRELCIGVAKSEDPEGPYIPHPEPMLASNRIDPHVFVEEDVAYLYWKEDSNGIWPIQLNALLREWPELIERLFDAAEDQRTAAFACAFWPFVQHLEPMECSRAQQPFMEAVTLNLAAFRERLVAVIQTAQDPLLQFRAREIFDNLKTVVYAQPLAPDGLQVCGAPRKVLENDQTWEAHVIEGMWVAKHADKYYMFYSGNDFSTTNYGIGVAVADSPLGPFVKVPGPLLQSTPKWLAPGHPSFAVGPGGEQMLFLHAYHPDAVGYKEFRALLAAAIDFDGAFLRVKLRALSRRRVQGRWDAE